MNEFFRFPPPHLAWPGQADPRDDKVLAAEETTDLLSGDVVLEEKVDGANLGFSLSPEGELRAQNRGQYLAEPHAGPLACLPACPPGWPCMAVPSAMSCWSMPTSG